LQKTTLKEFSVEFVYVLQKNYLRNASTDERLSKITRRKRPALDLNVCSLFEFHLFSSCLLNQCTIRLKLHFSRDEWKERELSSERESEFKEEIPRHEE